jgi:hypothetical protein
MTLSCWPSAAREHYAGDVFRKIWELAVNIIVRHDIVKSDNFDLFDVQLSS